MRMMKKISAVLLALVIVIGMLPAVNAQAKAKYDDVGRYYLAKGETETFIAPSYKGKISVIDDAGNKVRISGKKIQVTGKKTGTIILQIGKTKIGFKVCIGGNHKDSKVNYHEYDYEFLAGVVEYGNYIDYVRDCVNNDEEASSLFWTDKEENEENEVIRDCNRGICIGEKISDVKKKYPSWGDFDSGIDDDGEYVFTRCALYYDKISDCVFFKQISAYKKEYTKRQPEWTIVFWYIIIAVKL